MLEETSKHTLYNRAIRIDKFIDNKLLNNYPDSCHLHKHGDRW